MIDIPDGMTSRIEINNNLYFDTSLINLSTSKSEYTCKFIIACQFKHLKTCDIGRLCINSTTININDYLLQNPGLEELINLKIEEDFLKCL